MYDKSYATLLLAFLIMTMVSRQFGSLFLELLMKLSRPGATALLMGLLVYVYGRGLHYTFLVLAILNIYILRDIWSVWFLSSARRLYLDRSADESRFDPASSIDIQFANKTATHSAPSMYFQPATSSGLLVFPPSSETLAEMNGV